MTLGEDPTRPTLSVAVLGQVDGGKSTIVGHLRYLGGGVTQREMDKLEQQSADMGKASFKFAWLTDTRVNERERGVTIECTDSQLHTAKYDFSIVDTPGHVSFIKQSIAGAATTDHAVLVVDASDQAYEMGMADNGPTRELALVAFAMGAKQLIVAVNKMDALPTPYDKARFDQITGEVGAYVSRLGFKDADVQFVPVAGYAGENLVTKSSRMPWYEGVTLLEALDNLTPPVRAVDKPLRMPVDNVYNVKGVGLVVTGRVQTGVLKRGMQLSFGPNLPKGTVFSIESHNKTVREATPGMAVGVNLKGLARDDVKRGYVASDASCDETRDATSFTAQLVFLKPPTPEVRAGYQPVVYCHTTQTACHIREIKAKVDRMTGEVSARPASATEPLTVVAGEACLVEFTPCKRFVAEAFREYPSLARVVVRDAGTTIAVGVVKAVAKNGVPVP